MTDENSENEADDSDSVEPDLSVESLIELANENADSTEPTEDAVDGVDEVTQTATHQDSHSDQAAHIAEQLEALGTSEPAEDDSPQSTDIDPESLEQRIASLGASDPTGDTAAERTEVSEQDSALGGLMDKLGETHPTAAQDSNGEPAPDTEAPGVTGGEEMSTELSTPTPASSTTDEQPSRALSEVLVPGDQLLVLGPLQQPSVESACVDCQYPETLTPSHTLFVTVTQSPTDRLELWETEVPTEAMDIAIVNVGSEQRTLNETTVTTFSNRDFEISTKTVTNPSDLSRLGLTVSNIFSDWGADLDSPTVCFHSLSALLQYVSTENLFQFLHILTGELRDIGGIGHFHMDPGVHDAQTISTFETLFDTVIRIEDGERTIE